MSIPARKLRAPDRGDERSPQLVPAAPEPLERDTRRPPTAARPSPATAPEPIPTGAPSPAPRAERHRIRRGTVGFLVLCAMVLGAPVLGLVTLNALLAQTSFRVDDLQQRIQVLSQENLELTIEHAKLSAPGRVAAWARRHGMRLPDDIHALHVSSAEPAATRQGADRENLPEASLEPAVGDGA